MIKSIAVTAVTALALMGCKPDKAEAPATPAAATPAAPVTPVDPVALVARVKTMVEADENCGLAEPFLPRSVAAVDLGGRMGVIADCSNGMADTFGKVFVADASGNPVDTPLIVYGNQSTGEWRLEDQIQNLEFDPATKIISGSSTDWRTGCGWTAKWKWNGTRVALVEMATVGCPDEHSTDKVVWPTTPPTPEPTPSPTPTE